MKNLFYYDIFKLKNKEIFNWYNNFFWPVNPNKTQSILNKVLEINFHIVGKEKIPFFKNCFLTYNHTWNPYIILFNYLLLKKNLVNFDVKFSDQSKVMNYLYGKTRVFPLKPEPLNFKKDYFRIFKDKIKTLYYNLLHLKLNFSKSYYVINNSNILNNEYLKKINNWIEIVSIENLVESEDNFNTKKFKKLKNKIYKIHLECLTFARKNLKINIPEFVKKDILQYQYDYYKNIFIFLNNLIKNKSIRNCNKFFLDAPKTHIRAISCLVKDFGGKSVGFPHGSWICPTESKRPHFNEFLIYDEFVVYTKSQISLFNKNLTKYKSKYKINFISQDTDLFKRLKKSYEFKVPKKIKSVMLLELHLWCDDIRFEVPETMILYEFYFYLCNFFCSLGYKVFFKKRPKSKEIKKLNFFKNLKNVEVIDGDIQDPKIMNLSETIIFQYGLSSTFIPLVCSNIKLIYIDCGWENWNDNVMKLLNKRCEVVKANFDVKNRIRCNLKDFKQALIPNKKNSNTEFFSKYLIK